MIKFPVSDKKQKQLQDSMEKFSISEEDIKEKFVKGSGKGGQKINKSSMGVELHHEPTGVLVSCAKERSQALNRFFARRLLVEAVELKQNGQVGKREALAEKIRKQKSRRKRRSKNDVSLK